MCRMPECDLVNRPGTPVSKEELAAMVAHKVMIAGEG